VDNEVLLVRDGEGYRVLFGLLEGLHVAKDDRELPL
jgi:hypothetical protein